MVEHFIEVSNGSDQEEAQRLRLMTTSHLDDGEFARLLYDKIGGLIGPVFAASIESAVAAGDAVRIGSDPLNLFSFARPRADVGADEASGRALSSTAMPTIWRVSSVKFILRGIGLNEAAIASHLDCGPSPNSGQSVTAESA